MVNTRPLPSSSNSTATKSNMFYSSSRFFNDYYNESQVSVDRFGRPPVHLREPASHRDMGASFHARFEKRSLSEEPSAHTQSPRKRARPLPHEATHDGGYFPERSSFLDVDSVSLTEEFEEIELEAVRILGSFSQVGRAERRNSKPSITHITLPKLRYPDPIINAPVEPKTPISGCTGPFDSSAEEEIYRGSDSKEPEPTESIADGVPSEEEEKAPGVYRCEYPLCGKLFGKLYNLKSHERTHTDDRPFKCNQCEYAFSRNHDLKRHQKIHLGLKPYECKACTKKFSRMDALGRHRAKRPECREEGN